MKTKTIIISVVVLILLGLTSSLIYWFRFVRPGVEISSPEEKITDLCAKFPETEGKVSCEEAENLALSRYPGEIQEISLKEISLKTGPGDREKAVAVNKKVWLIKIKVVNPPEISVKLNSYQEVAVDIATGDVWLYRFF